MGKAGADGDEERFGANWIRDPTKREGAEDHAADPALHRSGFAAADGEKEGWEKEEEEETAKETPRPRETAKASFRFSESRGDLLNLNRKQIGRAHV